MDYKKRKMPIYQESVHIRVRMASISFGESIVAIDNLIYIRVISRLYAHKKDRDHSFSLGQKIIDSERAGDFNQALMDLGSSICTSKNQM